MLDLTLVQSVVVSLLSLTLLYVAFGDIVDISKKR